MSSRRSSKNHMGLRSKPKAKTAWSRLPFVGKDHGKHVSYWDVPPTGGFFGGIEVGKAVARLYLKHLRDERGNPDKTGSTSLQIMLRDMYGKTTSTKDEDRSLTGQRVGFASELARWLEAAAERLGSSFDAIPEQSFVQQANEALLRSDSELMAAIEADQKTKVS